MKILAFTDTHGIAGNMNTILKKDKEKKPELAICCGDFTTFENNMNKILKTLSKLNCNLYLIHGNHENVENVSKSLKKFKNIKLFHKKVIRYKKYILIGWGGGGFSFRDKEFETWIKKINKDIKKYRKQGKKLIFAAHAPFYNTELDKLDKSHYGNKSLSKFIKKNKIDIAFCGHFHENFYMKDKLKKTLIFNPGPKGTIIQ